MYFLANVFASPTTLIRCRCFSSAKKQDSLSTVESKLDKQHVQQKLPTVWSILSNVGGNAVTHSPRFGLVWWLDSFSIQLQLFVFFLFTVLFLRSGHSGLFFSFFFFFSPPLPSPSSHFSKVPIVDSVCFFSPQTSLSFFSWQQVAEKTPNLGTKCEKWEVEWIENEDKPVLPWWTWREVQL